MTIATNMAGRGTDIKLGPSVVKGRKCKLVASGEGDCEFYDPKACSADVPCGLHIIGTERHEARRIDRQLRGRSGRQGDPGSTRFFLSLEDDLMRLFGSDRLSGIMDRLGAQDGEVITHPLVTRSIENAQKRVEAQNFGIRKRLLEYDDVMNQQREVVYGLRNSGLDGVDLSDRLAEMRQRQIDILLGQHIPEGTRREEWNLSALRFEVESTIFAPIDLTGGSEHPSVETIRERIASAMDAAYARKEEIFGEQMREVERRILLAVIDEKWRDHLHEMDILKEGIYLRAYAQKDPLLEYKAEAYRMFEEMMGTVEADTVKYLYRVTPVIQSQPSGGEGRPAPVREPAAGLPERRRPAPASQEEVHASVSAYDAGSAAPRPAPRKVRTVVRSEPKVGRNDPCPCGSGKKYKKCCGAAE